MVKVYVPVSKDATSPTPFSCITYLKHLCSLYGLDIISILVAIVVFSKLLDFIFPINDNTSAQLDLFNARIIPLENLPTDVDEVDPDTLLLNSNRKLSAEVLNHLKQQPKLIVEQICNSDVCFEVYDCSSGTEYDSTMQRHMILKKKDFEHEIGVAELQIPDDLSWNNANTSTWKTYTLVIVPQHTKAIMASAFFTQALKIEEVVVEQRLLILGSGTGAISSLFSQFEDLMLKITEVEPHAEVIGLAERWFSHENADAVHNANISTFIMSEMNKESKYMCIIAQNCDVCSYTNNIADYAKSLNAILEDTGVIIFHLENNDNQLVLKSFKQHFASCFLFAYSMEMKNELLICSRRHNWTWHEQKSLFKETFRKIDDILDFRMMNAIEKRPQNTQNDLSAFGKFIQIPITAIIDRFKMNVGIYKMSEAEARIKEEIYRSDLVLREVLKYIPSYKDRQNIELSSRRLYKLSGEVPCRMYASLRLTICHYNEEKKDKLIFLEKFNGVTYSKITNLTFRRKNHNSDHVLSLLGRRFWPEVHSMIIQECLDAELLTALDRYFPCINDITCSGFTPDALDFLAQNTNFTKKIEKLGFIDFEMPEVCKINIFKTLTALNHITCWVQRSWPFDRFVAQLEVRPKVEFISIQHLTSAGNEVLELSEFSRYCHKLQYTDPVTFQASMLNSISSVPNLSHLNVTLLHLSQSDVVDFFLKFNHFEMESLWLAECVYSNDLIKLIRQGQKHPQLQSLKLKCWELRGDYNIPLLSICPKTIKKLELDDCAIFRSDLQYLEKNCQQLEEFVYKPSVPDGLLLDQVEDESGCINYEDLLRLLINLPKLNVFHVNEFIEPEFLLILCSSLTNIDTARFLMRGVDRDRAYNVLSLFYESVSITHSYYPFRDKLPIFEEGAENDTDSDIKKSEIYRAYSNRYLTEWKDAVDEARGRTLQNYSWFFEEYLKPDLSKAISTTKWCFVLQHRRKNCPADIPNFKALFCIE